MNSKFLGIICFLSALFGASVASAYNCPARSRVAHVTRNCVNTAKKKSEVNIRKCVSHRDPTTGNRYYTDCRCTVTCTYEVTFEGLCPSGAEHCANIAHIPIKACKEMQSKKIVDNLLLTGSGSLDFFTQKCRAISIGKKCPVDPPYPTDKISCGWPPISPLPPAFPEDTTSEVTPIEIVTPISTVDELENVEATDVTEGNPPPPIEEVTTDTPSSL